MLPLPANADPDAFDALIAAVRRRTPTPAELASLARRLADSGERFEVGPGAPTADLASTGGPGSLSTLLVPLALVAGGYRVPKLSVPGRPAGAIDSLATLSGYRARLSLTDAAAVLAACGYVHCLADDRFAPLDAALFAHRRRVGAVNVPPLAVASLLAKKLAFGVHRVGLDVRVFPGGNFGDGRGAAREAAELFVATARELSLDAVCLLHEGHRAWQPHFGRGESLVALHDVLTGRAKGWLAEHAELCLEMAGHLMGAVKPRWRGLRAAFERHLSAQGSSWDTFEARCKAVISAPRTTVPAPHEGFARANLASLRDALLAARPDVAVPVFADGAGIHLTVRPGAKVRADAILAEIRADGIGVDGNALRSATAAAVVPSRERQPLPDDYIEMVYPIPDMDPH